MIGFWDGFTSLRYNWVIRCFDLFFRVYFCHLNLLLIIQQAILMFRLLLQKFWTQIVSSLWHKNFICTILLTFAIDIWVCNWLLFGFLLNIVFLRFLELNLYVEGIIYNLLLNIFLSVLLINSQRIVACFRCSLFLGFRI